MFGPKAARYDELRPVDEHWWRAYEEIVRVGDFRGGRVLEIGCGTGRLAHALGERRVARVWAVDVVARDGRAREGDRGQRPGRPRRVAPVQAGLVRAGRVADVGAPRRPPARVRGVREGARPQRAPRRRNRGSGDASTTSWFARYFPSVPSVARGRFPDEGPLRDELVAAGFAAVAFERFDILRRIDREHALATMRAKAYSTFDLLPPDEYAAGLALAEAELPAAFDDTFRWLLAVADR